MKLMIIIGIGLIFLLVGFDIDSRANTEKEQPPVTLAQCIEKFQVAVQLTDEQTGNPSTVRAVGRFLVKPVTNNSAQGYQLYYFEEGRLRDQQLGIKLPYEFKRNYSAWFNGQYAVQIMLIAPDQTCGKTIVQFTVAH